MKPLPDFPQIPGIRKDEITEILLLISPICKLAEALVKTQMSRQKITQPRRLVESEAKKPLGRRNNPRITVHTAESCLLTGKNEFQTLCTREKYSESSLSRGLTCPNIDRAHASSEQSEFQAHFSLLLLASLVLGYRATVLIPRTNLTTYFLESPCLLFFVRKTLSSLDSKSHRT